MKKFFIEGARDGYTPAQCGRTMTFGELAELFTYMSERYGENVPVYLRNDNGYTYGSIRERDMLSDEDLEDEEADEIDE